MTFIRGIGTSVSYLIRQYKHFSVFNLLPKIQKKYLRMQQFHIQFQD